MFIAKKRMAADTPPGTLHNEASNHVQPLWLLKNHKMQIPFGFGKPEKNLRTPFTTSSLTD